MVGGKIIGLSWKRDGKALANVQGTGSEVNDSCSVRFFDIKKQAKLNAGIWWQAGRVFVTMDAITTEHKKIGYSHR